MAPISKILHRLDAKLAKLSPWFEIFLTSGLFYLAVSWPLFGRGYLVTLDLQFVPGRVLGILPNLIWQHLLLAVFLLAGPWLAFLLLGELLGQQRRSLPARVLMSLFYFYNPFVYQRLMVGHLYVLLGHMLSPLFLWFLLLWRKEQNILFNALAGLLFVLVGVLTGHFIFIWGLIWLVFLVACLPLKKGSKPAWSEILLGLGTFLLSLGLILWFSPQRLGQIGDFGLADFYRYAGLPDARGGSLLSQLALHGFWREGMEMLVIKDHAWFLGVVILWCYLLCLGIWQVWQKSKRQAGFLVLLGLGSLILALGVSAHTYRLTTWLVEYLPAYLGMREPQKFLSNLVLVYTILMAFGLDYLVQKFKPQGRWQIVLFLPVCLGLLGGSVYMFNGLWGQIRPISYPHSWYQARDYLQADDSGAGLLEMPPYLYQHYSFNNRTAASMVHKFFPQVVYRPEYVGFVSPQAYQNQQSDRVLGCYLDQDATCLHQVMQELGAGYLLYQKLPYGQNSFPPGLLTRESGFELVLEDEAAGFYRVGR